MTAGPSAGSRRGTLLGGVGVFALCAWQVGGAGAAVSGGRHQQQGRRSINAFVGGGSVRSLRKQGPGSRGVSRRVGSSARREEAGRPAASRWNRGRSISSSTGNSLIVEAYGVDGSRRSATAAAGPPSKRSMRGGGFLASALGKVVDRVESARTRVNLGPVGDMVAAPAPAATPTTTTEPKVGIETVFSTTPSKLRQFLKVTSFFVLWYTFNVGYNIFSKLALNQVQLPWTMAVVQLLTGIPYVMFLWATGLRKRPKVNLSHIKVITPLALMHMCAHQAAVISISAGAVGFVQIVKAAEPIFTSALSAIFLRQLLPPFVYLTLVPVVGGVALASLKELSFSVTAFLAAMVSNTCAASRSVYGKVCMGKDKGENMDAGNLYAVMTLIASLVLAPIAWSQEGRTARAAWDAAIAGGANAARLKQQFLLSGMFFYLYNEVAFYCLNEIHPVTHAVGNTMKRVVMIAVSILFFKHHFTPLGAVGGATAIAGVLSYSLAKAHADRGLKNKAAVAAAAGGDGEEGGGDDDGSGVELLSGWGGEEDIEVL